MWKLVRLVGAAAILVGIAGIVLAIGPALRGQPRRASVPGLDHLFGGSEIGVVIRDVEETDVRRDKLPADQGAVVQDVHVGSPADTAGLHAGDVVVAFDGETIRNARQLTRLVGESSMGRETGISVLRAGQRMDLKISPVRARGLRALGNEIRELNLGDDFAFARRTTDRVSSRVASRVSPATAPGRPRLGVEVQEINDQLAEYFGVKQGVLITQVAADTPARAAGLKAGDVITSVADRPVHDGDELRRLLNESPAPAVIAVTRDRKTQTFRVDLSEPVER